jgi:hypothetical protein
MSNDTEDVGESPSDSDNNEAEKLSNITEKPSVDEGCTVGTIVGTEDTETNRDDLIYTFSEYIKFIEDLPSNFNISRGQKSEDYSLVPSAFRKNKEGMRNFSDRTLSDFINSFENRSYQFLESPWDIKGKLELHVHAQHYGLPTKLLDFTYNHLISLLFAVEKSMEPSNGDLKNAVVYFVDPQALNLQNSESRKILNLHEVESSIVENLIGPVAVQGRLLNKRIHSQQGLFLYFKSEEDILKTYDDTIIRKVVIDKGSCQDVLISLFESGIRFSQIYPELNYLCKDILLENLIKNTERED